MSIPQHDKNEKPVPTKPGSNWVIKPGKLAALAASILTPIVLYMFLSPIARAPKAHRELKPSYKALGKVKNIHVSEYVHGKERPIRQIWMSQKLNIYLTKTEKEFVLLNLNNRFAKKKLLDSASVKTIALTKCMRSRAIAKKMLTSSFGVMPFPETFDIPENIEFRRLTDEIIAGNSANTEVYDLSGPEKTSGNSPMFRKWRGFINTDTHLPQRIEYYWKQAHANEYVLIYTKVLEYPSDEEIQAVIKDAGLYRQPRDDSRRP